MTIDLKFKVEKKTTIAQAKTFMEHQKGTWNEQISIKLAIQLRFNMLAFHIQEVTTVQSSIPL